MERRRTMLGDRDREVEEHRGFAIAPYGYG